MFSIAEIKPRAGKIAHDNMKYALICRYRKETFILIKIQALQKKRQKCKNRRKGKICRNSSSYTRVLTGKKFTFKVIAG